MELESAVAVDRPNRRKGKGRGRGDGPTNPKPEENEDPPLVLILKVCMLLKVCMFAASQLACLCLTSNFFYCQTVKLSNKVFH